MEIFSPPLFSDDRRVRLGLVTNTVTTQANKIFGWFSEKRRQFRSIHGNEALVRALLSIEKAPVEGTRLSIGERITIHQMDGSRIRLRICGVRSGGFSNAYTVVDMDDMKPYCLKEHRALPGGESKKNRNLAIEAEVSLRLGQHDNLVETYAAFYFRSRLFILSEYLPDESLDVKLKIAQLKPIESISYAIQICRAMAHAQAILPGFVHGDIKPGNCLMGAKGELKLGDFGLSSATGIGKDGVRSEVVDPADSGDRGWGGTTPYMAPKCLTVMSRIAAGPMYMPLASLCTK